MKDQPLVFADTASPASADTSWWARDAPDMPQDLLEKAVSRLGFMCMVYVVTFVSAYAFTAAVDIGRVFPAEGHPVGLWGFGVSVSMALAIAYAARTGAMRAERLLTVGLLFQVVGALAITLAENTAPWPVDMPLKGISWVTFWITIFPLLVPCRPWRAAIYAFAAFAMGPLGYFLVIMINDYPALQTGHLAAFFGGNFTAALWATIASRVVWDLGRSVREARQLGSYHLVEKLGAGGMGEVWHATHQRLIRPAAVKLIRPRGFTHDQLRTLERRFEREAQATAALQSPHTVVLYDFGRNEDGVFYYAMELLDGVDLEQLVQQSGPLSSERVVHMLLQVCHSLADAHAHGLVHRDIKPSNILTCCHGGDFDHMKVLDFGLVKGDKLETNESKLTADDTTSGTPAYIAPEMVAGEGEVDGRADIYSLGCVAYWLLTGQLVFTADTAMRLLFKHVQEAPVAPSQVTEVEIPAELETIVMACLAKAPEDRPQSAADLSDLLRAVPLRQPWTQARAERWWSRQS